MIIYKSTRITESRLPRVFKVISSAIELLLLVSLKSFQGLNNKTVLLISRPICRIDKINLKNLFNNLSNNSLLNLNPNNNRKNLARIFVSQKSQINPIDENLS